MPQDAFTLRYLCEELDVILKGGKINRIVQPTVDVTVFTVYTKDGVKKLLLDVNPSCPRIGLVDREPPTDIAASNFLMLLKKHLLSATVLGVSLVGFDRIVRIDIMPSAEFFDAPQKTLYVELMGRYSNVILTEHGKVMGGNRGVNFLDNNVRPLIAGLPYKFPPVGDKKQPQDESLKDYFDCKDKITAENLAVAVQGLAPSTACEIINGFTAAVSAKTNADLKDAVVKCDAKSIGERFFDYINAYIYRTEKHPCVVSENGKAKDVCVYPYGAISGERKFYDYLYQAEEAYFSDKSSERKFKALKDRLTAVTNAGLKKSKKRLSAVLARVKDSENAEENRIKGELLLANIYKLKGGEREITLENYYDGLDITIALDPRLSPALNAENYYKKYNKQKRAAEMLAPQKQAAQDEMDYLESVESEIALAETEADLKAIEDELTVSGFIKMRPQKGKKPEQVCRPREYNAFGFTVKAGRNNAENDRLTFSSKPEDIWLHAKDYHSSHVIVETSGKKITEKVLVAAAEICAYYSKGRDGGKTEIVYCERKFVKKPKKAKLGFCTYTDFKSITVKPDSHTELLKL